MPLQIWLVQCPGDSNKDLPTEQQIQQLLQGLNALYQTNGIAIRYYPTCIVAPDATNVTTLATVEIEDLADRQALVALGFNDKALNIYIVNETLNLGGVPSDGQYFPISISNLGKEILILKRTDKLITAAAHEIGHFWGLRHTHAMTEMVLAPYALTPSSNTTYIERVDRCQCHILGDGLCDTPADPNLSRFGVTVTDCSTYTYDVLATPSGQDLVDCKGKPFKPDVKNIMSYTPRECMKTFSPLQKNIINNAMATRLHLFDAFSAPSDVLPDSYEPDNIATAASLIKDGETQCHNFHSLGEECKDQEDWFKIDTKDGTLGTFNVVLEGQSSYFLGDVIVYGMNADGERGNKLDATISYSRPVVNVLIPCYLVGGIIRGF
jgi:hypothetical protein